MSGASLDTDVVARQAIKIDQLEQDNAAMRSALEAAKLHIICIGGPLNDNLRGYNREQMSEWLRVLNAIESGL
jgi:hypothetical protein